MTARAKRRLSVTPHARIAQSLFIVAWRALHGVRCAGMPGGERSCWARALVAGHFSTSHAPSSPHAPQAARLPDRCASARDKSTAPSLTARSARCSRLARHARTRSTIRPVAPPCDQRTDSPPRLTPLFPTTEAHSVQEASKRRWLWPTPPPHPAHALLLHPSQPATIHPHPQLPPPLYPIPPRPTPSHPITDTFKRIPPRDDPTSIGSTTSRGSLLLLAPILVLLVLIIPMPILCAG